MRKANRGVTLIELMVVVAVAAILASMAYASYRNSVIRANRTEATAALLRAAAAQERFYLQNNTYAEDADLTAASPAGLGLARTTESGYYRLSIANGDPVEDFTITATPVAGAGMDDDDDCLTLTIDESGARGATGATDARTRCWR